MIVGTKALEMWSTCSTEWPPTDEKSVVSSSSVPPRRTVMSRGSRTVWQDHQATILPIVRRASHMTVRFLDLRRVGHDSTIARTALDDEPFVSQSRAVAELPKSGEPRCEARW